MPDPALQAQVLHILDEVLGLRGRSASFDRATPLLGALPELDSMAVVALLTAFEDRLGLALPDEQLRAEDFSTVGSLVDFVAAGS